MILKMLNSCWLTQILQNDHEKLSGIVGYFRKRETSSFCSGMVVCVEGKLKKEYNESFFPHNFEKLWHDFSQSHLITTVFEINLL